MVIDIEDAGSVLHMGCGVADALQIGAVENDEIARSMRRTVASLPDGIPSFYEVVVVVHAAIEEDGGLLTHPGE